MKAEAINLPASGCERCGKHAGLDQPELQALLRRAANVWLCETCVRDYLKNIQGKDIFDEYPRHRPLTGEEICRLLTTLEKEDDDNAVQAIRFKLFSGFRWEIVCPLAWDRFVDDGETFQMVGPYGWDIYPENLNDYLQKILLEQSEVRQNHSQCVFPSSCIDEPVNSRIVDEKFDQVLLKAGLGSYSPLMVMVTISGIATNSPLQKTEVELGAS